MSTATTDSQARAEFIADLKRLNPTRKTYKRALEVAIQKLVEKHSKIDAIEKATRETFLETSSTQVESLIDAEIAASGE